MHHWAPLLALEDRGATQRDLDAGHRMQILAEAYGLGGPEQAKLLEFANRRFARIWHTMRYRADRFPRGRQHIWDAGAGNRILRAHAWLDTEQQHLRIALR